MKYLSEGELEKISPLIQFKHPNFLLKNIIQTIEKVGSRQFLKDPKFDDKRDILVACMFAYAVRFLEKREWFLRRGSNPPDIEMATPSDRPIHKRPFDYTQVEIVQVPPSFNNSNDAYEMIKRKKLVETYGIEKESVLLIFINHHEGPDWSEELKSHFRNYQGNFSQVWSIYLIRVSLSESFVYTVKNIKPGGEGVKLKLKEEYKKGLVYKHNLLEKFGAKII